MSTRVWLNLFKEETDPNKEIPYGKRAHKFLKRFSKRVCYSELVRKEIKPKLEREIFHEKIGLMERCFGLIYTTKEDYRFAKRLEAKLNRKLSFYDCVHIAVCKRLNMVLITRDKALIKLGKQFVTVKKPEELLH